MRFVSFPPQLDLYEMRISFQVVVQNRVFQAILWHGAVVRFAPSSCCPCSRSVLLVIIEHLIAECPAYEDFRLQTGLTVLHPLADQIASAEGAGRDVSFLKQF